MALSKGTVPVTTVSRVNRMELTAMGSRLLTHVRTAHNIRAMLFMPSGDRFSGAGSEVRTM